MIIRHALALVCALCICAPVFGADENILPKQAPAKSGTSTRVKTIRIAPQAPNPTYEPAVTGDPNAPFSAYQLGFYINAVNLAEIRAEKNKDTSAMTLLGELYAEGLGVPRDAQKSLEWYRRAEKAGDIHSIFALGMLHLQGAGVVRSKEEAGKFFRRAADKGHAHAAYNLALLYLEGQVLPQDFAEAAKLMRIAADKDIADAQHALAIFYQEGKGVAKNPAEAVKWLRRAARLDHVPATFDLAVALFAGNGTEKDEAMGALAMRRAALRGNPVAQNRYARMLNAGRGVEKNVVEAMAWHLMARLQDISDPMLDAAYGNLNDGEKKQAEGILRAWLQSKAPPKT